MTSPGWAVVTACSTLPPGGTWIVAPRAWPADNAIVRQRAAGTALIRMGMKRAGERDQLSVGTDRLRAEQYVFTRTQQRAGSYERFGVNQRSTCSIACPFRFA